MVSPRQVPDDFGGYTEVHGAFKEEYGLIFILVLRDEKLSKLYFFWGHAGMPRIMPNASRCVHGNAGDNTEDPEDNTDEPGLTIRDDAMRSVKV